MADPEAGRCLAPANGPGLGFRVLGFRLLGFRAPREGELAAALMAVEARDADRFRAGEVDAREAERFRAGEEG